MPDIVITERDGHTPAVHIPVAGVPTNFTIVQKQLGASVTTHDSMVRPKDLSAMADVAGPSGKRLALIVAL